MGGRSGRFRECSKTYSRCSVTYPPIRVGVAELMVRVSSARRITTLGKVCSLVVMISTVTDVI